MRKEKCLNLTRMLHYPMVKYFYIKASTYDAFGVECYFRYGSVCAWLRILPLLRLLFYGEIMFIACNNVLLVQMG